MSKNRSTMDLSLSSNERHFFKEIKKSSSVDKNFFSKYVKFYTFHSGFKKKDDDLLFVLFDKPISVAAVYSKTSTPSAPIIWDKKNNRGLCKLLIVNSGNANAHTGLKGIRKIDYYVDLAATEFNCSKNHILVSSTGVIGEQLDEKKIIKAYSLMKSSSEKNLFTAAKAIMTTDTFPKIIIKKIKIGKEIIRIFGIAKGSGMIQPNMGTMLAYIFIEANISRDILNNLLKIHLDSSFNSITVDSDTSTSDTLMLFSLLGEKTKNINSNLNITKISNGLREVMFKLALQVVSDGEGISKLIEINIRSARTYKQASLIAFSIANSPLVKTAIAGEDANWGRVIMAIGKADSKINQNKIKLSFGKYLLANKGHIFKDIDIKKLDKYMKNNIIQINIDLGIGKFERTVFSSDLTHKYIEINADYRS